MENPYYTQLEAERRSEKCRACTHFDPLDLSCIARSGWKLSKDERLTGCERFSRNIWGSSFSGGRAYA